MRHLIALLGLFFSCGAWATSTESFNSLTSNYFEGAGLNFLSHTVLQSTCQSSEIFENEIPCNPASLADSSKVIFGANLLLGDDYETLYRNKDLIGQNDKRSLALNLIKKTGSSQFETSSQLWARINQVAIVFVPLRWSYFSSVVNSSYSDISIHAMQEQSFSVMGAGFFDDDFKLGLAVRGIERKIIHESFNLFDALADIDKYMNVRTQKLVLIEPSFVYYFEKRPLTSQSWNPRLTGVLNQLGWVSDKIEGLPVKPYLETGLGVSPRVEAGRLDIMISYKLIDGMSEDRKYRIGTAYQYGLVTSLFAFDANEWSVGITNTFRFLNVGLNYKRAVNLDVFGNKSYTDSAAVEFRLLL